MVLGVVVVLDVRVVAASVVVVVDVVVAAVMTALVEKIFTSPSIGLSTTDPMVRQENG